MTNRVAHIFCALIVGGILAVCIFLEAESPAYLFINDTNSEVDRSIIGATSPSVTFHLAPGEKRIVDMPAWWGEPTMPKDTDGTRVRPRYNLILLKVIYLSEFPNDGV